MKYLGQAIIGVGNWVSGLSNRMRAVLVAGLLLVLLVGSINKIINASNRIKAPQPKADPDQIIQPMQQLFKQVSTQRTDPRIERDLRRLDSLTNEFRTKQQRTP
ncbi:hypothetical protein ACFQ4C_06775 [Larkinella insperata]|uniref:Uncharacterized protein n=1 Tax=Larkinella insperata TaxID=332158 RepID=A0ABW3QG07_9BACT